MADKTETITAHVMALTVQKLGKFFSLDDPGDMKTLERWHMRLSNLPNDQDYIDKLFEPFYAHKKMPNPDDLMKEHWRKTDPSMLSESEAGSAVKQLTWVEADKSRKSPYGKAVLALLYRRFGVPIDPTPGPGVLVVAKKSHKQPLNRQEFIVELKKIGETHNIPWQGV